MHSTISYPLPIGFRPCSPGTENRHRCPATLSHGRTTIVTSPVDHCSRRAEALHSGNRLGERNTWRVVGLSLVMMVVEIVCGMVFGSMALLADGWHMGTHVAALLVTAGAYWLAR